MCVLVGGGVEKYQILPKKILVLLNHLIRKTVLLSNDKYIFSLKKKKQHKKQIKENRLKVKEEWSFISGNLCS